MIFLILIFQRKAVDNVFMLVRRLISARMDFVILNFSFELDTVLWDLDRQKFLMLTFLDAIRSVRCLYFPLASSV